MGFLDTSLHGIDTEKLAHLSFFAMNFFHNVFLSQGTLQMLGNITHCDI